MAAQRRTKSGQKKQLRSEIQQVVAFPKAQAEELLNELEYGDRIAQLFDVLFPDRIVESIYKPFFRMLIRKHNILSACDLSCRTGQTLKMLQGLELPKLTGIDISPEMIKRSRKKIPSRIRFVQSELAKAPSVIAGQQFDMILCTKDALPLVLDDEALIKFFQDLRSCLTDNGLLVIEINNYHKIWRNKERFLPVLDRSDKNNQQLFFFMNDFHEELLVRNLMHLNKHSDHWELKPLSIPIRPLLPAELEFFLTEGKYSKWTFLGNYQGHPFLADESPHQIVIAKK